VEIDTKGGGIALHIQIFTDDLETILHNKYNVHSWMGTSGEHPDSRRLLREYVNERFSVAVNNGEKLELVTDSMTIHEDNMMWFYMKSTIPKTIRHIEIDNRLLTDFFSGQNNLMIVAFEREEKTYRLNRNNHKIALSL